MLGGRFPRGLCYRLGRMTSPRYQILNLLAPAAYPRQDIQTVLPRTPRPTGHPNRPTAYTASPHRLPTPKPTPSTISLSLSLSLFLLAAVLTLFVRATSEIRGEARDSPLRGHLVSREAGAKFFSGNVKEMQRGRRRRGLYLDPERIACPYRFSFERARAMFRNRIVIGNPVIDSVIKAKLCNEGVCAFP